MKAADIAPKHFGWRVDAADRVATITLDRPERKNPLTFESYAELRDLFRQLVYVEDVKTVVLTGAGDNFCSGGDVHEIIGPLTERDMPGLLEFTRMTGDLVFWGETADYTSIYHVALYIGNGQVIQAPQSNDVVKISSMWFGSDYFGAVRPTG